MPESKPGEQYYLVRQDILPDALVKTMQVKEMLAQGQAKTIHEAVERIGLSRSAFYKYKDGIFPLNNLELERIVTISMDLEHRSGILSKVLALIASLEGNVLTIHQTIPLQGMANAVVSIDTSLMREDFAVLIDTLGAQEGVRRVTVVGHG